MDTWRIIENKFDPQQLHHKETLFTLGNGYAGTRGAFEEGYPGAWPTTLVHGVFDDLPLFHTELVNCPNWLPFILLVEGERFGLDRGRILAYERILDLGHGVLTRWVRWQSPAGHMVDLVIERFMSLADEHALAIRYQVTPRDFRGLLEFHTGLSGCVDNQGVVHWDHLDQGASPRAIWLHSRTRHTGIELCLAASLNIVGADSPEFEGQNCEYHPTLTALCQVASGQTITAEKRVVLYTSRETADVRQEALAHLDQLPSYEALRVAHEAAWEKTWTDCDIVIEGDEDAQRAVRYNLFQLLAAVPRQDGRVSIPAKTLSGYGYKGHVFWDTEIFMLPFFTFTQPALARNLLMYRYHTLPGARRKAKNAGFEGAIFAWESAATGDEVTPRWAIGPTQDPVRIWCGDIELHINADVAYAVWQYWQATGDDEFMVHYGAEIILDTAVFWGSRAEWNQERGSYEFNDVIGPDENHEHVNNSVFTNCMAQWHLKTALETLMWLRQHSPEKAMELTAQLDLCPKRLAHWADVISRLYISHDHETGLMEQFDGFFDLEDPDLRSLEPRTRSVQSLLGVERTQQVQVIKQPDVLMLLYLLGDHYDYQTKQVNWDYYVPRTDQTYGSSLSPSIHAILACELGQLETAYEFFMEAALMDLEGLRGNTQDGIHGGSAGGTWQAVVFGFGGVHLAEEGLTATPRLPQGWRRLRFRLQHRGRWHEFDFRQ